MVNNLNEKKNTAFIIATIITTLAIMFGGVISGLVLAVRERHMQDAGGNNISRHLLVDAAYGLRDRMSALRLCIEAKPAEAINKTALVHAVRAETALECDGGDYAENRSKEAFLNDISTVLHSYDTTVTIEMSDKLYELSTRFYEAVSEGVEFVYDGELITGESDGEPIPPPTDEEIAEAAEFVKKALSASVADYIGAWDGHMEFNTERNGRTGYAIVCGNKITEYSFMRTESGDETDTDRAKDIALKAAAACGYDDLVVKASERVGRSIAVIMCRDFDGALAADDLSNAIVYGGEAVMFTAGGCDREHNDIPTAKKTESEARRSAAGGGEGTLVVHSLDGRDRICYEYRYELDDGVHYVYVCAESGKQIEVK